MANQLEWKRVKEVYDSKDTNRQTFGGGATFVPDSTHGWVLDDHPEQ